MYILLIYHPDLGNLASEIYQAVEANRYQVWLRDPAIDWNTPKHAQVLSLIGKTCSAVVIATSDHASYDLELGVFLENIQQHNHQIFWIRSNDDIPDLLEKLAEIVPDDSEKAALPVLTRDSISFSLERGKQSKTKIYLLIALIVGIILGSFSLYWLSNLANSGLQGATPVTTTSEMESQPTDTDTPGATSTPTEQASYTMTSTTTPTFSPTSTASSTATSTHTLTATATLTSSPTVTASSTATPTPTATPTETPTHTPTSTFTATESTAIPTNPAIFVTNTPYIEMTSTQEP